MSMITVQATAEINLTENPEKVKLAVENILGAVKFEIKPRKQGGGTFVARATGTEWLTKLYNLLRREHIRDAARSVMFKGLEGNTITFYLNKQVAFVGHLSFSEPAGESPLGSIKVTITCDNPRELIDWLAPRTT
jgi:predicted RNA binding protein with dsRBD fold (UPF0201 family)